MGSLKSRNNKSDVKLHLVAIEDQVQAASIYAIFVYYERLQLYTAWQGLKGERLKRAAVGFLESLVGLALEVS